MLRYLGVRCAWAAVVLFGVVTIVFFMTRLSGDPALLFLPGNATPEDVATFKRATGLDQPILVQYVTFLGNALHGDFGRSIRQGEPALWLVASRLPNTFLLISTAVVVALLLSVPSGLLAALHRGTLIDTGTSLVALLGQSFPQFWLGIMLILVFGVQLKLLPPSGLDGPRSLVLPGVTLGLGMAAVLSRLLRSNLVDVLSQDYVRTGRAKGLDERAVVLRHALKNAVLPSVTILGLQIGGLLGTGVIVETVFGYPGVGRLALQAIGQRDYPIVQAFVFILGSTQVVLSLVVDILYTYLDPRIRYGSDPAFAGRC